MNCQINSALKIESDCLAERTLKIENYRYFEKVYFLSLINIIP